jgi:hypothetical protein
MAGFCRHGDELKASVRGRKFDWKSSSQLVMKGLLGGVMEPELRVGIGLYVPFAPSSSWAACMPFSVWLILYCYIW